MSNIFIVNAGTQYGASEGKLNNHFTQIAKELFESNGHQVQVTRVEDAYDAEAEVQKILWADTIIYQMPAWWMGAPWTLKKYIDEVFSVGYGQIFDNDGRTRSDPSRKYGSGGLLQGRNYMLSVTWNAPLEAFVKPEQFFDGQGVDPVYYSFHKANEFVGLSKLPTFMSNDVIKQPEIEADTLRYQQHLKQFFL